MLNRRDVLFALFASNVGLPVAARPAAKERFNPNDYFDVLPIKEPERLKELRTKNTPLDSYDQAFVTAYDVLPHIRDLTISVIDQICTIPEVQERLHAYKKRSGKKIEIKVLAYDNTRIVSCDDDYRDNSDTPIKVISIGANFPFIQKDAFLSRVSLNGTLIHESYHATDPTDNAAHDLSLQKQAARQAIDEFLTYAPQYRDEYGRTGLIMGIDYGRWESADSLETMDSHYRKGVSPSIVIPRIKTKEAAVHEVENYFLQRDDATSTRNQRDIVNFFIGNRYQRIFQELRDSAYEFPAIDFTNKIVRSHYPQEPIRTTYESEAEATITPADKRGNKEQIISAWKSRVFLSEMGTQRPALRTPRQHKAKL